MSRIREVLKNKNRLERDARIRRDNELKRMRREAAYKAVLRNSLKLVDTILDKPEIKSVVIEVQKNNIPEFTRVIYETDMAEYSISQLSATKFAIGRKELDF